MEGLPKDVRADLEYLRFAFSVFGVLVRWESKTGEGSPCPTLTLAINVAVTENVARGDAPPTAEALDSIVEFLLKKMESEGSLVFDGTRRESVALTDLGRQESMNTREQYESQRSQGLSTGPPAFDPRRRSGRARMVFLIVVVTVLFL